jgi:hypothetical protein
MHQRTISSTSAEDLIPRTFLQASVSWKISRVYEVTMHRRLFFSVGSTVLKLVLTRTF